MYKPSPRKLGHLVLKVRDVQASCKFYEEVVGLTVSDWIGEHMVFMRSGQDHHDLALLQIPDAVDQPPNSTGIEHFSYLVDSFEDIEKVVEMLQERNIPIDRGPGKHGPGENCFIVFKDPDGHNVEFYSDMVQIDEEHPYEASVWDNDLESFDQWKLEKFVVPPPERFKEHTPERFKDNKKD